MRRNRVMAVGAAVVVAVIGAVAFRQLTADGAETAPAAPPAAIGTKLDLPTSSWEPGQAAMQALGGGVLRVDPDGCVFLADSRTYVAWPAGYTAYQTDGGELTLYSEDGDDVAHDGDRVRMGGGYIPVTAESEHPCLPAIGEEHFAVQSAVRVVRAGS